MSIDQDKITEAILATNCPPLALEEGSELVTHWLEVNAADAGWTVLAVEAGFVLWLDEKTVVIGAQDLLTREAGGIVGNEWKTTKEKTKYWNEQAWLASISEGSQIAIYALALQGGTYYEAGLEPITPRVAHPSIRVRAVSKSSPPVCWPSKGEAVITFTDEQLGWVRNGLLAKAAALRGMKKAGVIPFQLPGIWCENKFRRVCEHYEDCTGQRYPPTGTSRFDQNDPAARLALPWITSEDPELVVLSASSYGTASECLEKYRRNSLTDEGKKEESLALDTGTVLHAGVAEWYRGIRALSL